MENQRLFIFIGLVFLGMTIIQTWEHDYGQGATTTTDSTSTEITPTAVPSSTPASVPSVPQSTASTVPTAVVPDAGDSPTISGDHNTLPSDKRIRVLTDFINVDLDSVGGDIRSVKLKKYPVSIEDKKTGFHLMTDKGEKFFVAQSGFAMAQGQGPTHEAIYKTDNTEYALQEGKDNVAVNMTWTDPTGIKVTKTYTFHRSSHLIDMDITVENGSKEDWSGSFYRQTQRTQYGEEEQSMFMMRAYMGGVIYTPEELYEKISFSDMKDRNINRVGVKGGWTGMMQHYFLGAWIPKADEVNTFSSAVIQYRYYLRMIANQQVVKPGQTAKFSSQFYAGPKDQVVLENIAEGLDRTADYGFLYVIAKPLYVLLEILHSVFGNWGWAIIFLTLIIKLVFYKLSETSYKSMANMRKLQPRMKAMKERHGDDRQAMNKAMMEMYKKEKINPLGGCLPILVQIPVFIALYWVLLEAVELRHAPFMLWIHDLSAQDPYYILPVIMGATMILQQRLNPAPLDPVQAKVMMALPFVFTLFFLFFPSGLVLYWVVNNSLSIAQQWVITKRIEGQK